LWVAVWPHGHGHGSGKQINVVVGRARRRESLRCCKDVGGDGANVDVTEGVKAELEGAVILPPERHGEALKVPNDWPRVRNH
jgi:hypothetical protein